MEWISFNTKSVGKVKLQFKFYSIEQSSEMDLRVKPRNVFQLAPASVEPRLGNYDGRAHIRPRDWPLHGFHGGSWNPSNIKALWHRWVLGGRGPRLIPHYAERCEPFWKCGGRFSCASRLPGPFYWGLLDSGSNALRQNLQVQTRHISIGFNFKRVKVTSSALSMPIILMRKL